MAGREKGVDVNQKGDTQNNTSIVVYIAGPYRGESVWETHRNIQAAELVAAGYWERGFTVICPHKNSGYMSGVVNERVFLEGCLELLRRSDMVVMVPGWEKSEGAKAEFKLAAELGKHVHMFGMGVKVGAEDTEVREGESCGTVF